MIVLLYFYFLPSYIKAQLIEIHIFMVHNVKYCEMTTI